MPNLIFPYSLLSTLKTSIVYLKGLIFFSLIVPCSVSFVLAQSSPSSSSVNSAVTQIYPNRPVKIIGPAAGTGADLTVRIVAKYLSKVWKQSVIVENKPGAGGSIGTGFVVNADPDGYTLLVQSASFAANPAIYKKLPYDPAKTLVDIDILGMTPYVLVVHPDGPYKSIKDLVSAAKTRPGDLSYASAGVGSSTHLAAEFFNQFAGIKLLNIPYKGSPDALTDIMAGRSAFYITSITSAIGQINSGKLKALGVTSKTRADILSNVPTIAEQGFSNFEIILWVGFWAPIATPLAIVEKINADLGKAMQDPEVKDSYAKVGIQSSHMDLDTVKKFVSSEIVKYQQIATKAGIEPQ
jgi:tripartite-type tricarboxylate transporter receptor subunit TctC